MYFIVMSMKNNLINIKVHSTQLTYVVGCNPTLPFSMRLSCPIHFYHSSFNISLHYNLFKQYLNFSYSISLFDGQLIQHIN